MSQEQEQHILKVYAVKMDKSSYETLFLSEESVVKLMRATNEVRDSGNQVEKLSLRVNFPNGKKETLDCDIWVDAKDLILQEPDQNSPNY